LLFSVVSLGKVGARRKKYIEEEDVKKFALGLISLVALVLFIAACGSEKEVIKEVKVPGETIVVEKEVIKEVKVPGETITVVKEVIKEVKVPGETVVVEKVVIQEVPVEVVVEKEVIKEVQVPGKTIIVEKEVIKEVPVEKVVVKEVIVNVGDLPEDARYGGTLYWTPESALNSQRLFVSGVYIKGGFIDVVYDKLLAWDKAAVSQPQMLDSWIVENDRRFLFKLRDGLLFHDGHPVDSADVVASLERWMVGDPIGRLNKQTLVKMGALDENTIELEFSSPNGTLIYYLGASGVGPILKKEISDVTELDADPEETIGSGPGKSVEWVPDSKQVIERFDDYFPRKEPQDALAGRKIMFFDRIVARNIPDMETRHAALMTGEIDMIQRRGERFLKQLQSNPDIGILYGGPGLQIGFYLNMAGPFANDPRGKKIRRAIIVATDMQQVLEAQAGTSETVYLCGSFFPCRTWMENQEISKDIFNVKDLDLARAMIKETGYTDQVVGLQDPSNNAQQHDVMLYMAPLLESIGLNVKVNYSAGSSWGYMIGKCDTRTYSREWGAEGAEWQIANMAFGSTHFRPLSNPFARMGPGGPADEAGRGCWKNEEYQNLVIELATKVGQKAQKEVLDKMQKVMWDDPFYFPAGQGYFVHAFNINVVGVQPNSGQPYQIGAYWTDPVRRGRSN